MRFRGLLLAGCVLLLAGCNKDPASKSVVSKAEPPKPTSNWEQKTKKDEMTDRVTWAIATKDQVNDADLQLNCDDKDTRLVIASDIFLAANEWGKVLLRFDDEKAQDYQALLTEKVAIIEMPRKLTDPGKDPFAAMRETDGMLAVTELSKHHKRLRIRLESFNNERRNLDFNLAGYDEAYKWMESKCHPFGDTIAG